MTRYEYKVVPAPRRGEKARGVRSAEDRFALALSGLMNTLGRDGWEYLRADTLPLEERHGLAGRISTSYQNMLVFRRSLAEAATTAEPVAEAPAVAPLPGADPLSDAATARLASVHKLETPRARPPRLVTPFGERSGAPSVGPAPGKARAEDKAPPAPPAE